VVTARGGEGRPRPHALGQHERHVDEERAERGDEPDAELAHDLIVAVADGSGAGGRQGLGHLDQEPGGERGGVVVVGIEGQGLPRQGQGADAPVDAAHGQGAPRGADELPGRAGAQREVALAVEVVADAAAEAAGVEGLGGGVDQRGQLGGGVAIAPEDDGQQLGQRLAIGLGGRAIRGAPRSEVGAERAGGHLGLVPTADADVAGLADLDVVGGQPPVDHAPAMGEGDGAAHRGEQIEATAEAGRWPAGAVAPGREADGATVGLDVVGVAGFVDAHAEDALDRGVVEARRDAGPAQEPLGGLAADRAGRPGDADRPGQALVEGVEALELALVDGLAADEARSVGGAQRRGQLGQIDRHLGDVVDHGAPPGDVRTSPSRCQA
jgi:hypothetical protein